MEAFEFTIIAAALEGSIRNPRRLLAETCPDATILTQHGALVLGFVREAPSLARALTSAIRDIQRAGATVRRIEPDPFVTKVEIAKRSGISDSLVTLYIKGERGSAPFPLPVARATSRMPVWDWAVVARWMYRHGKVDRDCVMRALVVRRANLALEDAAWAQDYRLARRLRRPAAASARAVRRRPPLEDQSVLGNQSGSS